MSAVLVALIQALIAALPEFELLIKALANKDETAAQRVKAILEPWPLDAAIKAQQAKVDAE